MIGIENVAGWLVATVGWLQRTTALLTDREMLIECSVVGYFGSIVQTRKMMNTAEGVLPKIVTGC